MTWAAVLFAGLACYGAKLAGLSVPQRVLDRPKVQRIAALLPLVLLSALVAVQTLSSGRHLVIDPRLAGVAVAALAAWRRWPFLVVVALACVTTALLRRFLPV